MFLKLLRRDFSRSACTQIASKNMFMFEWIQKFYKCVSMPNGYSDAMQIFTKILKPISEHLRQESYLSVIFVDDSYLQGYTEARII